VQNSPLIKVSTGNANALNGRLKNRNFANLLQMH